MVVCPLIFPSLNGPVHLPTINELSGNYLPLPGTSQRLQKQFPSTETWLNIRNDGSFTCHDLPTKTGETTINAHGSWTISKHRPFKVSLSGINDQGQYYGTAFNIKGQSPPFLIETWHDPFLCALEFTTDWQRSPARLAYTMLSMTDFGFQVFFGFVVLVFPWFLSPRSKGRAFGYPFIVIFTWGLWRMAYYDPTTNNDIPGIGYIVVAFVYSFVASFLFAVPLFFFKVESQTKDRDTVKVCPGCALSSHAQRLDGLET